MQPQKMDSVLGYLTPKRLLTNIMNPNNKTKINRSVIDSLNSPSNIDNNITSSNSPRRKQRESYKKKSTQPQNINYKKQYEGDGSQHNNHDQNKNQSMINIKSSALSAGQYRFNEQTESNKFILAQNDRLQSSSRISQPSGKNKDSNTKYKSILNKYGNTKSQAEVVKNKQYPQNLTLTNSQVDKNFGVQNRKNTQISYLVLQDLLKQLTLIKNTIQLQLEGLKNLLDDTSVGLELVDSQFEKIKEKVLIYASKTLDSAFKEYKQSLPNWNAFETIEKKGNIKLQQIIQKIQIYKYQSNLKQEGKQLIAQTKIQQYRLLVEQIKLARDQCFSHRPILFRQKIQKLEDALKQFSQF